MHKIILFTNSFQVICGLYMWTLNFVKKFPNRVHIMSRHLLPAFKHELEKYATCEILEDDKVYHCNLLIHNFQMISIPSNIVYKDIYTVIHCDYINQKWNFEPHHKYIAVSEHAAKVFSERFKIPCSVVAPFMPEDKPKKVYRFICPMRITHDKGFDLILQFCELLRQNGVYWQLLMFTEKPAHAATIRTDYPELVICNPVSNEEMLSYMADADYTILLSRSEGFGYAIHESLSVGTPVLTLDIPVFSLVKDGYNGYKLPEDMKDVDVNKILADIPKGFEYTNNNKESEEKWGDILC